MMNQTDRCLLPLIEALGGIENILQCDHCMTRLRLTIADSALVNEAALRQSEGVLGVVASNGQLQIILGAGKAQTMAKALQAELTHAPNHADTIQIIPLSQQTKSYYKQKQTHPIHHFLAKFATIFTPLIPGFIAAGLLLGLSTLMQQWLLPEGLAPKAIAGSLWVQLINYLALFSKGLFSFLGILIGYNTQKAFGGSAVNGAIIASLFVLGYDPEATSGFYAGITHFFGWTIDPRGNIIGILLACIVGAWIEQRVRRLLPAELDMLLTSAITLLLTSIITYSVLMPIGRELFIAMSWLFHQLNSNPLGAALLAGLFLIAVVFGVHQGFTPVYLSLMESQGFNTLFPILAMAGAGQVGAALALYVRAQKGAAIRQQIIGALIPACLGIGEPLIYGVTLPRLKPFITACFGGAIGGFWLGFMAWQGIPIGLNSVYGPSGLVALPLMTSQQGVITAMLIYLSGLIFAYVGGFLTTYFFGCKEIDLR